jgi:hypothetical protein
MAGRSLCLALALVTCALAVLACGSSTKPSSSAVTSSRYAEALEHADCMRSHGVPSFPDPSANGAPAPPGGAGAITIVRSPTFRSAIKACQSLAPSGTTVPSLSEGAKLAAVKFSECMRAHGVRNYPDPQFSGLGYRLTLPPGLGPSSPAFKSAETVCNRSAGYGSGNTGSG